RAAPTSIEWERNGPGLEAGGPMEPKQVIVIRRDLGMRRGKEIAQGAHASGAWLTSRLFAVAGMPRQYMVTLSEAEEAWVKGLFTKVTCQVPDLESLIKVQQAADDAGLVNRMIYDAGKTEFHGVETATALAIG